MGSLVTPVFIGRRTELNQLENALTAVQSQGGRCVLVSGEAGIGKSRLIAEIRTQANDGGFTILAGRCFEQDRSFPYAPLIDMLRPFFTQGAAFDLLDDLGPLAAELAKLLPELADHVSLPQASSPLQSELEKRRLFEALTNLFLHQAGAGLLMMIVEDLHWSDEASLEFLLYFVRRMAGYPILLLLSRRTADSPSGLVELLAGLDREPIVQELRLDPLTRAEVAALLEAILDQPQELSAEFVQAVYNLSEGIPFFAEEICTSLIASGDVFYAGDQWRRKPLAQIELPDSLQRLVQLRLDRLSQPAKQLINLAAVSGRSFDLAVLQTLTGLSDEELLARVKELMAAQLVVEENAERFSFRHALTREALYARLLERERQALHRQLVRAIEQIYAGSLETHLETLAYHAYEAKLWHKTLGYAQQAGQKALALFAPHAAAEQFTRAIHASGQLSQAPDSTLYRLRGQAYDTLGNFDRARADYEAAFNTAQIAGDPKVAWHACLDLGLLWASRDYARTGKYCRQALELARAMNDPAAIGHSLNRLGNWRMNRGQPFEALDDHREALQIFENLDDRAGIAATLDLLAMTSNQCGDAVGTVTYYQRAIPLLRQLNDRQTLASSLTMLSNYTLDEVQIREALELTRQIEWRSGEAYALTYLGSLLAYRGDYGQGLRAAQSGLELAQAINHRLWQAWADIILGLIYLELLAPEQAYQHFHSSRETATQVGSSFMATFATGFLASTCILQDRLDEAVALLPEHLTEPALITDYTLLKAYVELELAHQHPAQALALLDRMQLPEGENWLGGMVYYYGSIYLLHGEILRHLDQPEQAQAVMQSALDLYREQGVQMGQWRIHLALGKLYQAASDLEQAGAAFRAARAQIDKLATTLNDDELRENFNRRAFAMIPEIKPLTPRQAAKQEFGGLTRRERQVAAVVAQGLSNQEIADELVVSIKTVEAHVSHILSKLGFSSRAQIAAWAVDKGLAQASKDLDSLL
jgi:predicted ATPase/DNA-binding CsgD family transcriptional regulator